MANRTNRAYVTGTLDTTSSSAPIKYQKVLHPELRPAMDPDAPKARAMPHYGPQGTTSGDGYVGDLDTNGPQHDMSGGSHRWKEPDPTPPGAPTNLEATDVTTNSAVLSWAAPRRDGRSEITGYWIEALVDGSAVSSITVPATQLTYELEDLDRATAHSAMVSAINDIGESPAAGVNFTTDEVEPDPEPDPDPPGDDGGEEGDNFGEMSSGGFDPSEHNAPEVIEYLNDADDDEFERVLKAERRGKGRRTVLARGE